MIEAIAPAPIHSLLVASLAVWKVRGSVAARDGGAVIIRAEGGVTVGVEPVPASERPVRWLVRCEPGSPGHCTSIVGVLSAVREALGIFGGPGLQFSPARSEA